MKNKKESFADMNSKGFFNLTEQEGDVIGAFITVGKSKSSRKY